MGFNEKINGVKLFNRDSLMTVCADKVAVRDYIAHCGLEHTRARRPGFGSRALHGPVLYGISPAGVQQCFGRDALSTGGDGHRTRWEALGQRNLVA